MQYFKIFVEFQLPFALIGTLNGIFTYGDSYGVKIINADSDNLKIVWKMYHSNITLIMIENNQPINDNVYFDKMNLIFDSLVLLYGLDDLINIKNVEKFKREIRVPLRFIFFFFFFLFNFFNEKIAYNIIDNILDNNKYELFGDITNSIDIIMTHDAQTFQVE